MTTTSERISTTVPETMAPGFSLAQGLALFEQFGKTLSHVDFQVDDTGRDPFMRRINADPPVVASANAAPLTLTHRRAMGPFARALMPVGQHVQTDRVIGPGVIPRLAIFRRLRISIPDHLRREPIKHHGDDRIDRHPGRIDVGRPRAGLSGATVRAASRRRVPVSRAKGRQV